MSQIRLHRGKTWFIELWGLSSGWRIWMLALIGLIVWVWDRIATGVENGKPPLVSWMALAETAVVIMLLLTIQRFAELMRLRADVRIDPSGARRKIASLILQFMIILVGNSYVIYLMWGQGFVWKEMDTMNATVAGAGLVPLLIMAMLRRRGVRWAWLQELEWSKPWAKFCYVLVLKVFPQFTQAVAVGTGAGRVDAWGVVLLVVLGSIRFWESVWGDMRRNPGAMTARALGYSTIFDFLSVVTLFAVVVYVTPSAVFMQPVVYVGGLLAGLWSGLAA